MKRPRISILDPRFTYRNSANTDVRKTWRKARERMESQKEPQPTTSVVHITRKLNHG